jgi:hypothetical protein
MIYVNETGVPVIARTRFSVFRTNNDCDVIESSARFMRAKHQEGG